MATLLELGQRNPGAADAGAIVTAVCARRRTLHTLDSGIPLNTIGADVSAVVYRVISPLIPGVHGDTYGARLQVLATSEPDVRVGATHFIDGMFQNFLGDERMERELDRAGVTITHQTGKDGRITGVKVHQGEVFSWRGIKYVNP